jgi:glycosyltransferase involved in cell wall biosynthesis
MKRSENDGQQDLALFIAYHYPPIHSTGTARSLQFIRFLPEFGYSSRVLTTSAFGSGPQAADRAWEPLSLYRRLFQRIPVARGTGQSHESAIPSHVRTRGPLTRPLGWLSRWLLIPDGQITWLPHAFWIGLMAILRERPVLIYSTFPPGSAHLLALALKRVTGLPWVADFRDSWVYDPLNPALEELTYRRWVEQRLEGLVVGAADQVVCATDISADYLRQAYPSAASRIQVITNGHTAAGVSPRETSGVKSEGPMCIVHTGSFSLSHPRRTPLPLFRALDRLLDEDRRWTERLRIILVGPLSREEAGAAVPLQRAGILEVHPAVAPDEAVAWQRQADLLLLVDHKREWLASNVPGKFYEYLATGKPIVALCGPGVVERMVAELGVGFCAAVDDPESIARVLTRAYQLHTVAKLPAGVDEQVLGRFHRRELTAQLARCFDRARRRQETS